MTGTGIVQADVAPTGTGTRNTLTTVAPNPVPSPILSPSSSRDSSRDSSNLARRNARKMTSMGGQLGGIALPHSGGIVFREFLRELSGLQGMQTYTEMSRNEPVIGSVLLAMEQMIKNVTLLVTSDGMSNDIRKAKHLISTSLTDMRHPWGHTMSELTSMFTYGWVGLEKVLKIRQGEKSHPDKTSKYNDGAIGLAKLSPRAQESIHQWEFDETSGEAVGMWQYDMYDRRPNYPGRVLIPLEKCLFVRTTIKQGDPEGQSLLRTCYRPWYIKKNVEEIMVIGVERDLVGLPTLQPPKGLDLLAVGNEDIYDYAINLLVNTRNDDQMGVLIPADWTFILTASPGTKQFNMMEILDYYDKRMAVALLGTFLMLGLQRAGSMALASELKSIFMLAMKGWVTVMVEAINHDVVDDLLEINGFDMSDPQKPQVVAGKIEDPNLDELSQYLTRLVKVNLIQPDADLEQMLRRFGGLTSLPESEGTLSTAKSMMVPGGPVESLVPGVAPSGTGSGGPGTHVPTAPPPGTAPKMVERFRVVSSPRRPGLPTGSAGKGTIGNNAPLAAQEGMVQEGMVQEGVPASQEELAAMGFKNTPLQNRFVLGIEDTIITHVPTPSRRLIQDLFSSVLPANPDKTVSIYFVLSSAEDGRYIIQEVERYHPRKSISSSPDAYLDFISTNLRKSIQNISKQVDEDFITRTKNPDSHSSSSNGNPYHDNS